MTIPDYKRLYRTRPDQFQYPARMVWPVGGFARCIVDAGHAFEKGGAGLRQDQRRQLAAMHGGGVDARGMGKTGWPVQPGLVPEDDMAEPAIIDVCPERVTRLVGPQREELSSLR